MEDKGYTAHLIKIIQNAYNITSFTKQWVANRQYDCKLNREIQQGRQLRKVSSIFLIVLKIARIFLHTCWQNF